MAKHSSTRVPGWPALQEMRFASTDQAGRGETLPRAPTRRRHVAGARPTLRESTVHSCAPHPYH